jgi:hypothetical protein
MVGATRDPSIYQPPRRVGGVRKRQEPDTAMKDRVL